MMVLVEKGVRGNAGVYPTKSPVYMNLYSYENMFYS